MEYKEFLESKQIKVESSGFEVEESVINPMLFDFQRDITRWALKRGKAALFEDCGLGKTFQQLEWARIIHKNTRGRVLIFAPLAVAEQTVQEGLKINIDINKCDTQKNTTSGINITNYEKLHKFNPDKFDAIILDESSILKSFSGKYRKDLTEFADGIKYRLTCTATPAPNDLIEIINHAEFLGIMSGKEIIALYFTQDGNSTHNWRLKRHAEKDFWKWLASWSVAIRKPSDLGYDDGQFILPSKEIHQITVDANFKDGTLFTKVARGLQEQRKARKNSLKKRVEAAANLINNSKDTWVVWCDYNDESKLLTNNIPDAVEVKGSDPANKKGKNLIDFTNGKIRVLVTKPSIAGFGMNWQHCNKVAFVGLSNSYEQIYQATRRVWRFGQKNKVDIYYITSKAEGAVLENIQVKERKSEKMMDIIVEYMKELNLDRSTEKEVMQYEEKTARGENWTLYLGDAYYQMDKIENNSVGLIVYSPPFPGMYAYTNSVNDIGNTRHIDEMIDHYRYFVGKEKLLRILKPGRLHCVHLMQLTAMKSRDGYIGIKDYRGKVIEMMEEEGWIYHGEVTIDKNPQVQATRNKERGLLFKTLANDSSKLRMALADYLLLFRKPGENKEPIKAGISKRYNNPEGWITEKEWIEWAAPVWYRATKNHPGGIRETDVLNVRVARDEKDERHLCPLQLGVIERAVKLWSNPGDTVFSPFAGIGSEGYQALKLNRKFIGCELKKSYFETAQINLEQAINENAQMALF